MVTALVVVGLVAVSALVALGVVLARRASAPEMSLDRPGDGLSEMVRAQGIRLDRITDAMVQGARGQDALRDGLERTRTLVSDLRTRDQERRTLDDEGRASLRRLEATFLGAASRGRVGENVVWEALSALPPDMVDTGFRVNGKIVEFSLKLPDGRRMPVDSKWAGSAEVERLDQAEGDDRTRLSKIVERLAAERAREVAKYLDPSITTPFAVAAVPDAVYGVLRRAHLDAFAAGVLLVPYSTALPLVLALYSLCCRLGPDGSEVDVGALVAEVGASLDRIERSVENQVERAATMAHNAAGEIRTHLGRARGSLGRARPIREAPSAEVLGDGDGDGDLGLDGLSVRATGRMADPLVTGEVMPLRAVD